MSRLVQFYTYMPAGDLEVCFSKIIIQGVTFLEPQKCAKLNSVAIVVGQQLVVKIKLNSLHKIINHKELCASRGIAAATK
jgi:hypothetical protein